MNKTKIIFVLLLSIVTIMSCEEEELPVTYDDDVATIITNNCATANCHAGATPSGSADLTTYANVKIYADNGKLVDRMNSITNPMPTTGLLSEADRMVIDNWIQDGTLEK